MCLENLFQMYIRICRFITKRIALLRCEKVDEAIYFLLDKK